MSVTYRPDGQELAVATLNGEISFWNPHTATQTGSVAGRHDLEMGRKETDKITAKQSAKGKWVRELLEGGFIVHKLNWMTLWDLGQGIDSGFVLFF